MKNINEALLVCLLLMAVGTGIWLNNTAWRHRRLMWQLQGAFIGGGVGFVAGRLTATKGPDE